jgi:hypothetical protein
MFENTRQTSGQAPAAARHVDSSLSRTNFFRCCPVKLSMKVEGGLCPGSVDVMLTNLSGRLQVGQFKEIPNHDIEPTYNNIEDSRTKKMQVDTKKHS